MMCTIIQMVGMAEWMENRWMDKDGELDGKEDMNCVMVKNGMQKE